MRRKTAPNKTEIFSEDDLTLNGSGSLNINAPAGHGIVSKDSLTITSGGTVYVRTSGDGIDANRSVDISGGTVTVSCPAQGDSPSLDYDTSASIISGTFLGTGSSGMAQSFSEAGQGVISVNAGSCSAGTVILLTDASGKTLLSACPEESFSVIIFSSPELVKGETYTLTVGSSSGEFTAS